MLQQASFSVHDVEAILARVKRGGISTVCAMQVGSAFPPASLSMPEDINPYELIGELRAFLGRQPANATVVLS